MLDKQYNESIAALGTAKQCEIYKLWCAGNSQRQIAKSLGRGKTAVQESMKLLEKKATAGGILPAYLEDTGAGAGRFVGKVTTHIKGGDVVQEWVRTDTATDDAMAKVEDAIKLLADDIKGKSKRVTAPKNTNDDLVTVYPLFDKHIGMMAWGKEVGEDYDLNIAQSGEEELFKYLTDNSPQSKEALVVFGGDYYHCDDDNQVTPSHKNKVDVDGRSDKVFGVGIVMARRYIDMALERHEHVTVEVIRGNHDPILSMALRHVLSALYANNKRIDVVTSPSDFAYYHFGKTLLAFRHGDKMKYERMYQVITTDMREAWGQIEHCTCFSGHFHSEKCIDVGTIKMESLRSTVAAEAYSHRSGYRTPRTGYAITYSKTAGEIGRTTRNI